MDKLELGESIWELLFLAQLFGASMAQFALKSNPQINVNI